MLQKIRYYNWLVVVVLIEIMWIVVSSLLLKDTFARLSSDDVTELSKTLVQSVGILVSLFGAAGFFYISKFDELAVRVFSKVNNLEFRLEMAKDKITIGAESIRKCRDRFSELPASFKDPDLRTKKETEKGLEELEKANEKFNQLLGRIGNLSARAIDDSNKMEAVQKLLVENMAVVVGFFLLSIIMAIIAFVSKDASLLSLSFDFVVIGIVLLFAVWACFYSGSKILRDLFKTVLEVNTTLRMVTVYMRNFRFALNNILEEINQLGSQAQDA